MSNQLEMLLSMFARNLYIGLVFIVMVFAALFIQYSDRIDCYLVYFEGAEFWLVPVFVILSVFVGIFLDAFKYYNLSKKIIMNFWGFFDKKYKSFDFDVKKLMLDAFNINPEIYVGELKNISKDKQDEMTNKRKRAWTTLIHEGYVRLFYHSEYHQIFKTRILLDVLSTINVTFFLMFFFTLGVVLFVFIANHINCPSLHQFIRVYINAVIDWQFYVGNLVKCGFVLFLTWILKDRIISVLHETNQFTDLCLRNVYDQEKERDTLKRFANYMAAHTESAFYKNIYDFLDAEKESLSLKVDLSSIK